MSCRLAVISDVHADVEALRDALVQIDKLGCDRIVCCGDLVGYGKYPEETLRLLQDREIPCVLGNHDRCALEGPVVGLKLSAEALSFLGSLPLKLDFELDGVRIAVRHAHANLGSTPEERRRALVRLGALVLVVGDTHQAFAEYVEGAGLQCSPGAVLRETAEPRAGVPVFNPVRGVFESKVLPVRGTFGVVELPALRFTLHSVTDGAVLGTAGPSTRHEVASAPPKGVCLKPQWLAGPYAATAEQEAQWVQALENGLLWESFDLSDRQDADRASDWVKQRARAKWARGRVSPCRPVGAHWRYKWMRGDWVSAAAPRSPAQEHLVINEPGGPPASAVPAQPRSGGVCLPCRSAVIKVTPPADQEALPVPPPPVPRPTVATVTPTVARKNPVDWALWVWRGLWCADLVLALWAAVHQPHGGLSDRAETALAVAVALPLFAAGALAIGGFALNVFYELVRAVARLVMPRSGPPRVLS